MGYTVSLQDAPSKITEQAKTKAEEQFQRALERTLGGEDEVIAAYKAWQLAEEVDPSELSKQDTDLAKQWIAAATRAYQEGFKGFGESEAWFEIRVER